MYSQQPREQPAGNWNKLEYRPLEGFAYAIAPFNFTALGATLVGPAALLGNVVIWKPSDSALHASWLLYQILLEAGLPKDVIQFVPGDAEGVTDTVLQRPEFGGLSFIGSTDVFKGIQKKIGNAIGQGTYNSYPRVVGETGGKNWGVVHSSADIRSAALNTIRAAFEYQGQKCSATSRAYVARSVWPEFKEVLVNEAKRLTQGNSLKPEGFANFMGPVIHDRAYAKVSQAIDAHKQDSELELLVGGQHSDEAGYYIEPTVFATSNPDHAILKQEYFGPLLGVYVYDDAALDETVKLIDNTTEYGLTGSIFARDRFAIEKLTSDLENTAGNFYINDKSTGAVVGQQWFGGARKSGTDDKAGSQHLLSRFVAVRNIKENAYPLEETFYPSNY